MGVEEGSLDVLSVGEMLNSSGIESSLLAEEGNSISVVMSESLHLEDCFSNIRSSLEVDLEKLSLEMSFFGLVSLESFKKEGGGLLNLVALDEELGNLFNGGHTRGLSDEHLGKSKSSLGIDWDKVGKNLSEINLLTCLLDIRHDLVILSCLNESLNNSFMVIRSPED